MNKIQKRMDDDLFLEDLFTEQNIWFGLETLVFEDEEVDMDMRCKAEIDLFKYADAPVPRVMSEFDQRVMECVVREPMHCFNAGKGGCYDLPETTMFCFSGSTRKIHIPIRKVVNATSMRKKPEFPSLLPKNYLDEVDVKYVDVLKQDPKPPEKIVCKKRPRSDAQSMDIDFASFLLPDNFKLPVSKSPIMEAFTFCALKGWGLEVVTSVRHEDDSAIVIFKVVDFDEYYKYSCAICSKQKPTEDPAARIKALRRWFSNFPKKKLRKKNPQYTLEVKSTASLKVFTMLEKHRSMINTKKPRLN